jgi:hypothetical protein
MKKTVLLTSAALVAMTGVATAGTLTTDSSTTLKPVVAAKEAVAGGTSNTATKLDVSSAITGGTFTPGNPGDPTATPPVAATQPAFSGIVITPAGIPLGTLTDGIMNVTSSGKWTVVTGTDTLSICAASADGSMLEQQLTLKNGNGTNSLIFDKTNGGTGSLTNGERYVLGWGTTCAAAPTDGTSKLQLELPAGTTSATLTVTSGLATTQQLFDTAGPATFLTVANQLSAAVTKQVKNQINFNDNFLSLVDSTQTPPTTGLTSDTFDVTVTAAQSGVPATFGAGDKVITTITVSDPAGLATSGTATVADITGLADPTDPTSGSGIFTDGNCVDIVAATGKIVCTSTATAPLIDPLTLPMTGPVTETFEYTVSLDQTTPTAITEKTFSVTTEFDFADATMQDRTLANSNALLTNASAGTWTFNGTTIHVPLLKGSGGTNTFIKLQSKVNASVRGLVLCSDGVSRPVDLGTITAGTPKLITSDNVVAALGSAGTVDQSAGYAMTLSVTADQSNIFGYANTVDAAGNSRFIPLTAISGIQQ